MIKEANLKMDVIDRENFSYISFKGVLDENNPLPAFHNYRPIVIIDTHDLKSINSCGARDWIEWLSSIKERVYFIRCSTELITFANEINEIFNGGIIVSFDVPSYCESCGQSVVTLVSTKAAQEHLIERPQCNRCNQSMTIDDPLALYFSFLSKNISGTLPSEIESVLAELWQHQS